MNKKVYKIKRPQFHFLFGFFITFCFYIIILFIAIKDWRSLGNGNSAFLISFLVLFSLYIVFYIAYVFSNKIEIDYEKMELREKLLTYTISLVDINKIEKICYYFPNENLVVPWRKGMLYPNRLEMAAISLIMTDGKIIRTHWLIGKENTFNIIKDVMDVNKKIGKIAEPTFLTKQVTMRMFMVVIAIAILLGIVIYFWLKQ